MENLEYQKQFNEFTGRSELQKAVDGTDGVAKAETGYEWTQTDEELEVVVPLPKGVTSKDVDVKYLPKSLEVKCKMEPLVVLPLFARVDPDGCTWTLDRDGDETKLVQSEAVISSASTIHKIVLFHRSLSDNVPPFVTVRVDSVRNATCN